MNGLPQTYYDASAARAPERPRLSGNVRVDICVIGGGYTGLSAALHLARRGAHVVLLEAGEIGAGASGRNGGQIHTGLRKDQAELERWLGKEHARDLWRLTEDSKALLRELIATHGIECALKDGLVIAAHNEAAARALTADTRHLWSYGYTKARMMDARETGEMLGTPIYPAARFDAGGGHLHPLNFARGLAAAAESAGATLFEHSRAREIEQSKTDIRVICENGTVIADRVLVACDAFTGELLPEVAPYIAHVESFIVATAPLGALDAQILSCDAAVADTRHVLDYYRKADGRLLFAGREAYFSVPSDIARLVRPRMKRVFPALGDIPIEYAWSGTVGITRTRMPHFGRIGARVLFAHGYSGQGVALSLMGGKLLAEAAFDNNEGFDVFARVPAQKFPGGAILRKPLVAAALTWFKLVDRF
ncbi:MAG TPA: FAD-binding oxidoreductase [Rhizomicrobium sp.]|nr:FAD-binding oxidoreductase [Rhizomicrobium sp.]